MTAQCNNKFLEQDGYCTQCGRNHLQAARPAAKRSNNKSMLQAQRQQEINAAIEYSSVYSTARNTAQMVLDDQNVKCRIVFHNAERQSHWEMDVRWKSSVIVFGYQMLDNAAAHGDGEYPTVARALGLRRVFGLEAVRRIALHEAAHAIAYEQYKSTGHGKEFIAVYKSLLELYA